MSRPAPTLPSYTNYQRERINHWDEVGRRMDTWRGWGATYHQRLTHIYQSIVAPKQRVIEIGCAQGDLLAALQPQYGLGVDFSGEMIRRAKKKHPELSFIQADAHDLYLHETFDIVVLSDLLNDLWDVQTFFNRIAILVTPRTRIILNVYSRLWELPLAVSKRLGMSKPALYQNWLTVDDIAGLFYLTNFKILRHWQEILCPLPIPLIEGFFNQGLVKIWPFNHLALTNFIVALPCPHPKELPEKPRVSVIIPARNEAGNIPQIFERTPEMGGGTELIFIEGHSKDNTYSTIQGAMTHYPERQCRLFRQDGEGKGDAVRLGFSKASGDILMILDADLTVPPEDLPRFYDALCTGKGEFVNGVRLVYPMEKESMQFLNMVANKFFGIAFSWILGQSIKDTLCGTKVLWKTEYELIAANRGYFGDFDPFGDFDLLFGAARLHLKIVDLPIRYRERTYGTTNIKRWRHGWLLIRMLFFAAGRIKFV